MLTFYGLEMVVTRSQRTRAVSSAHPGTTTAMGVFWLHMASFAVVMNVMKEERPGHGARGFVPFAMGAAAYSLLLLTST